jgi:hypothetical protein
VRASAASVRRRSSRSCSGDKPFRYVQGTSGDVSNV